MSKSQSNVITFVFEVYVVTPNLCPSKHHNNSVPCSVHRLRGIDVQTNLAYSSDNCIVFVLLKTDSNCMWTVYCTFFYFVRIVFLLLLCNICTAVSYFCYNFECEIKIHI